MRAPNKLFKREGKKLLPSFLVSDSSRLKECLEAWADVNSFPTQVEIDEILGKVENLLIKVEDLKCKEMTKDFTEAFILFTSALNEFLKCHNADNAIRDLIVCCAKIILILIDPLSLDGSFEKLRKRAEISSKTAYDTELVKKERKKNKKLFKERIAKCFEGTHNMDEVEHLDGVNKDNYNNSIRRSQDNASHLLDIKAGNVTNDNIDRDKDNVICDEFRDNDIEPGDDRDRDNGINLNDGRDDINLSDSRDKNDHDESLDKIDVVINEIRNGSMDKSAGQEKLMTQAKDLVKKADNESSNLYPINSKKHIDTSHRSSSIDKNPKSISSSSSVLDDTYSGNEAQNSKLKARKIKEVTNKLRKKLDDKISKTKHDKIDKSLSMIIKDPEMKKLWEEFVLIIRHLMEAVISGCIVSGNYAIEPLKALKNRRSFIYGGISTALENAINTPQASTLKQIALATIDIPLSFVIGTGYGMRAACMETNKRMSYINDLITAECPDKRSEDIIDRHTESSKLKLHNFNDNLRRTKSLSDLRAYQLVRPLGNYAHDIIKNIFNNNTSNKKEGYEPQELTPEECEDGIFQKVNLYLKRSHSFGEAMIEEKKENTVLMDPSQRSLDEWLLKNDMDMHEGGEKKGNNMRDRDSEVLDSVNNCNFDSHNTKNEEHNIPNSDAWSFGESMMRLREIGKRTRIASSIRSTLLRRETTKNFKTNVKDLLNPKMRDKLVDLIETIDTGDYSIIIAIMSYFFCSYSEKTAIITERKKIVECIKKLLSTLTSQENIDTLLEDLQELRGTSNYTNLKVIMSLRREKDNSDIDSFINKEILFHESTSQNQNATNLETLNDNQKKKSEKLSYAKLLAKNIIDLIESNEGRNVIADILDIYMSIKLEKNRKRLIKTYSLLKMTYRHYGGKKPFYLILITVLKDLMANAVPVFLKEAKMISIPLHKATEIKGFELFFTKEPLILIRDLSPDKMNIVVEHRATDVDQVQKIVRMENNKHVLIPEPLRNFVKLILKTFPTSIERFQKWDISEGEKGPKWFVNVKFKGMHLVIESEEVKLLATNRHKGTLGNHTYNAIRRCRKVVPKNKKKTLKSANGALGDDRQNVLSEKDEIKSSLIQDNKSNAYIFNDKKSYSLWKGSVSGMVYGDGITLDLIFETAPRNEDDMQDANIMVKKIHKKLLHSTAMMKGKHLKLKRASNESKLNKSRSSSAGIKEVRKTRSENSTENNKFNSVSVISKILTKVINSKLVSSDEKFRLAGIKVNVPYYSSRLRVKGSMSTLISMLAEKKIRELIKDSVEDYIIKQLSKLNYERCEITV